MKSQQAAAPTFYQARHRSTPFFTFDTPFFLSPSTTAKSTLADRLSSRLRRALSARWRRRCSTRWTSSASAASPSRRRRGAAIQGTRRPGLQPQPDRHPGARRLFLRGQPLAAACEGACWWSMPARRRGADGGQLLHRRSTSASRSCRCSTRWTCRRPIPRRAKAEIEDVIGIDASDAIPMLGQDRRWASTTSSRR